MKIMFEPLFSALIGGWEIFFIGLSLLVFLLVTGGILVAIFLLIKKDSSKKSTPPIPPPPSPAIPSTEIIRSNCPQCGTPLSSGTLAGLCPVCLLKTGAATETFMNAKQPPFIPPATAELAAKFPQLEILELIGKGGMGAVYKARQKQLDRIVALKILPPGIGDDPAFAERFTREAKALRKQYRQLLRAEIVQTLADPADLDEEMRALFGAFGN